MRRAACAAPASAVRIPAKKDDKMKPDPKKDDKMKPADDRTMTPSK
ncbi:MAG TPA: hypothetical protein VGL17_06035 [Gemmatimonadaceae bacterium]|jgi:hypothetical protein